MRIAWHVGLPRQSNGRLEEPEKLWEAVQDLAVSVVNSDTKVELKFLDRPLIFEHPYHAMINNMLLVEDVLECQKERFDAVLLAPAIDPGLDESRAVSNIPVVGSLESALVLTQFVGRRIGIVGVRPGYITMIEQNVRRYGLRDRLIDNRPVRLFNFDFKDVASALDGNGDKFVGGFERVARDLIADGADIIVGACQFLGPIFHRIGYKAVLDNGVTYVDVSAAGLKVAEMMASFRAPFAPQKSQSPYSPFRSLDLQQVHSAAQMRKS